MTTKPKTCALYLREGSNFIRYGDFETESLATAKRQRDASNLRLGIHVGHFHPDSLPYDTRLFFNIGFLE